MKSEETQPDRGNARLLAVMGACAVAGLAVLGIHYGANTSDGPSVLAGSGHGATNEQYVQPVVGAANLGATATWTTPLPTPEVEKATPAIKAH